MTMRWARVSECASPEYAMLFGLAFGAYDFTQMPALTVVAEDDGKLVGFVSGYWRSKNCFYIQYAGIDPDYASPPRTARLLREAVEFIGCENYLTLVGNNNRAALYAIMRAGFTPIGFRQSLDGKGFVEWALEVKRG